MLITADLVGWVTGRLKLEGVSHPLIHRIAVALATAITLPALALATMIAEASAGTTEVGMHAMHHTNTMACDFFAASLARVLAFARA